MATRPAWGFEVVGPASSGEALEGPVWDGHGLLFSRPSRNEIVRYDPVRNDVRLFRHSSVRTRGLAIGPDGRLYGAQSRARRVVWFRDDGGTYYLNAMLDGRRHNDPQHLLVDGMGRIWFTDLWTAESTGGPVGYPPLGHCSVLRLARAEAPVAGSAAASAETLGSDWILERMTFDTVAPRGLVLSPDEGTLYVSEAGLPPAGPRLVKAYPLLVDGSLGPAVVLHDYASDDASPAGLAVDREGFVLVALSPDGGAIEPCIDVIAPDGRVVERQALPAAGPTACAFGGPDLDVLFVTTRSGALLRAEGTGRAGPGRAPVSDEGRPTFDEREPQALENEVMEDHVMSERTRVAMVARESVPEFEPIFRSFEGNTGTLPNNLLVMARRPSLLRARAGMAEALRDTTLDRPVRDLVFLMASLTTGCRYCQAHRTTAMVRRGTHEEKVQAIWEFETSPLFSDAERAALRLARDSAIVPNAVTDAHFVELRRYFTEEQIIDIVAQSCNAAWSNRWNDTMATPLEPIPLDTMAKVMPAWDPGPHRPDR